MSATPDRAGQGSDNSQSETERNLKWVFLAIMFAGVWPAASWLKKHPEKLGWPCFLIGFLPFVTYNYHLLSAPIAWPAWVGYSKGLELWVVDFIAAAVLISVRNRLIRPLFMLSLTSYFIVVGTCAVIAQLPEASTFYLWQLLRVIFIYFTVANICAIEIDTVAAILAGLAAGEIFECLVAIWQRFGLHVLQAFGTMDSQNELGLASHFVTIPFFAIMLGGRRGWLPVIAVAAGLVTEALTTSRATVGLGLAGLALVWMSSSLSNFSGRKLTIAFAGLLAITLLAPLALTSFEERFSHSNLGLAEDAERLAFKRAAWMMWADYPEGVGPNNFALVANTGGYFRRAGGVSAAGAASNVHNVYILVLAESGPLGLACFIFVLAGPLFRAFKGGLLSKRWAADDPRRDILIGTGVTMLIVYIHSTEEWVMITSVLEYLLAITFGLVSALSMPGTRRRSRE
jgi:O-antigen ligase